MNTVTCFDGTVNLSTVQEWILSLVWQYCSIRYNALVNTVTYPDGTVHLRTQQEWILSLIVTVIFTSAQRRIEYCHLFDSTVQLGTIH